MNNTYDFVIIGSGFGGSVSALRLAEKGYKVAVIEAGKRYGSEDFAKTNWNIFKYMWLPFLRCFGILRMTPLSDVLILSGTGVGGGSLGYGNTLLVPPDPFFKDPQWADMGNWRTTLSPFYEKAKKMLGVTTNTHQTASDLLLQEVAKEMGRGHTFKMQDVGIFFGEPNQTVPDPFFSGKGPDRSGCNLCGGCLVGCRHNAKNSLDKNYLYLAEKLGVTVFPETKASLIHEQSGGGFQIDTVSSTSLVAKNRQTFFSDQLILSAGVLGTLDLLFKCREQGTLKRLSSMLGARVRTNSEALTCATSKDSNVDYTEGIAITSSIYPDNDTHIEPVRYPVGSDLISLFATPLTEGGSRYIRPLKWLWNSICHPINFLRVLWPFEWAKKTIILLVMQTLDNSMRVFRKQYWWWPFSKLLASEPETKRERVPVYIPIAQTVTRTLAEKINGIPCNSVNEVLFGIGSTAHILGGCAIGPSPEDGVIDEKNLVYGYKGLYVIDGSMIPANLGVNPSLTITAMAEHAMSHIPAKKDRHHSK